MPYFTIDIILTVLIVTLWAGSLKFLLNPSTLHKAVAALCGIGILWHSPALLLLGVVIMLLCWKLVKSGFCPYDKLSAAALLLLLGSQFLLENYSMALATYQIGFVALLGNLLKLETGQTIEPEISPVQNH